MERIIIVEEIEQESVILLDQLLKEAIEENNKPELENFEFFYIGDKGMMVSDERIVVYLVDDENSAEGHDFEDRGITYYIDIQIKETTDYLQARKQLINLSKIISDVLKASPKLSDYSKYMKIKKRTPLYEQGSDILKTTQIAVIFDILEEDPQIEKEGFDEIINNDKVIW